MSEFGPAYDADIPEGSPTQEHRDIFPGDRYLRLHGFKIHSRPRVGEPIWDLHGELFRQSDAVLHISDAIKRASR